MRQQAEDTMAYDENVPSDEPSDSSEVYGPSTVIAARPQVNSKHWN